MNRASNIRIRADKVRWCVNQLLSTRSVGEEGILHYFCVLSTNIACVNVRRVKWRSINIITYRRYNRITTLFGIIQVICKYILVLLYLVFYTMYHYII